MRAALGGATIVLIVAVIYANSTAGYFFDDDFHWLAQTQGFNPATMLDLSLYNHFYRPVIETYFFIGLSLFGCHPYPFHLASIGIHLLTIGAVFGFTRTLSDSRAFAWVTAVMFAVQPGFTEVVTWIGAITDQLPVLWYVLTLWLHVLFLRRANALFYVLALTTFVLCHLTHESSATLLPMMVVTEFTFGAAGGVSQRLRTVASNWTRYAPFTLLLVAYLALAYVVNTRSYLVQDGYYRFGLHAVPNILNYIIGLYIGQRVLVDYVVMLAVLVAVLIWGTARMRFAIVWIVVTLAPVSFFTWGNAPRYLYLPAVGFAMLVADLLFAGKTWLRGRLSAEQARTAMVLAGVLLALRFGVFAKKAADSFPVRAMHYERFATELRRANPGATAGATVYIDQRFLEGVPDIYREPAARVALCLPNLRLQMR